MKDDIKVIRMKSSVLVTFAEMRKSERGACLKEKSKNSVLFSLNL